MQPATDSSEPRKSATRGRPQAARRPVGTPLKSAARPSPSYGNAYDRTSPPRAVASPADARAAQQEFFLDHLASGPNKRGKPYSSHTINAYRDAVVALGKYLTGVGCPGGYEDVDVSLLNGFLAQYRADHSQGGTVTKQSNLRVFFAWLVEEYEAREVFNDRKRHRYAREDEPVPILGAEFITDLLKITAGRSFLEVRDQAIIRVLLLGPRRAEVAGLYVEDLDLRSGIKTMTTGRMKGNAGRVIPLPRSTVLAMNRWLRTRATARSRPIPTQGPLWIALKGGGVLRDAGIYQMLRRRAEQAGYDPDSVHPHLFRHTAAHQFLADGGSEGDLMQLMGWKDAEMTHRYGRSAAQERAVLYAARHGFGEPRTS